VDLPFKNKPGAKLFGANIPPTHDNAIACHSPLQTFIDFSQNEYSKIAFIFLFDSAWLFHF
jgi:hypothetical protein